MVMKRAHHRACHAIAVGLAGNLIPGDPLGLGKLMLVKLDSRIAVELGEIADEKR